MSDIIQVDFESLNEIRQRFAQRAEATAQTIQHINQSMAPLQDGGWIGLGAEAFFKEMTEDFMPGLERLRNALELASQHTQQIGETLQEAQEQGAARFDPGGYNLPSGDGIATPGIPGIGGGGIGNGPGNGFPSPFPRFPEDGLGRIPGDRLPSPFPFPGFPDGGMMIPTPMPMPSFPDIGFPSDPERGLLPAFPGSRDDHGIPRDWLKGVLPEIGSGSPNPVLPSNGEPFTNFGAGSGGGSGGGTGGGSGGGMGETPPSNATEAPTTPTGGGSGGGTEIPTEVNAPSNQGRGFRPVSASPAASAGSGVAYAGGASTASAPAGEAAGAGVTGVAQGGEAASGGASPAGFMMGLAAASPLIGALGKLIVGQRNDNN
jgi:WXG100 family type VII secretion target